jgi:predicted ATP-binding protein involved in virulence
MARYRLWLLEEDQEANKTVAANAKGAIKAFNTALNVFLDDFSDVKVMEEPVLLNIKKDDCQLSIVQLSDGERSFFAMISDLVRRLALANPLLDDPLQGAGVVLIDELELHLHPKWQREVVEKLRATFPNIQFITTTHSPFIIQTAREGEVIKLDGDLIVEPAGRTLEEVARLVMDVTNTDRSPRYQQMLDAAHRYLELVEEAQSAEGSRRKQIQLELIKMLAPFTDNPAYTALLERRGLVGRED